MNVLVYSALFGHTGNMNPGGNYVVERFVLIVKYFSLFSPVCFHL